MHRGYKCKICKEFIGADTHDNMSRVKAVAFEHLKTHRLTDLLYLEEL